MMWGTVEQDNCIDRSLSDDDEGACPCPLCREPPPTQIVEIITKSAALQGPTMTQEQFLILLDGIGREGAGVTGS